MVKNSIVAGFCGVGKSTFVESSIDIVEFECYKYNGDNFPDNYIQDILEEYRKGKTVLISTDRRVINELNSLGYKVLLVYPKQSLKEEYATRYIDRGSHPDFLNIVATYWEAWLTELEQDTDNDKIVLGKSEFLSPLYSKYKESMF